MTAWNYYKNTTSKNGLLKAVLRAYKREYAITTSLAMFVCCLQIVSPFILKALIDYINDRRESTFEGIMFVVLLVLSQGLVYIINEHLTFYSRITGNQTTNAMIAMIYDKMFKISKATNKKYSQGQLVNFIQVDAVKMQFLASSAPIIMRIPFLLVFCFLILFYYLGWAMVSGVIVFALSFVTNTLLSRCRARL